MALCVLGLSLTLLFQTDIFLPIYLDSAFAIKRRRLNRHFAIT